MENISILAQLIIAASIIIVWVFRYDNIVLEFKQYGISDLVRNGVGASKIALATTLALGVAYDVPVVAASLCMAFLMICAQACHVKVEKSLEEIRAVCFAFVVVLVCCSLQLRLDLSNGYSPDHASFFGSFFYCLWSQLLLF